ncbi:hypothetical protein EJ03DRAFT_159419 [Teratosphaeria nubilosa]|uniref:Uncharacterized protein n=1 Tax=Teratosphaeria nubilosa TaxID=161662 RepID=A0A6G1L462_9PEZI|nr:hypothetical protein EJ03DRAFT_159419 [Teratosphaeria nubilosa]
MLTYAHWQVFCLPFSARRCGYLGKATYILRSRRFQGCRMCSDDVRVGKTGKGHGRRCVIYMPMRSRRTPSTMFLGDVLHALDSRLLPLARHHATINMYSTNSTSGYMSPIHSFAPTISDTLILRDADPTSTQQSDTLERSSLSGNCVWTITSE